MLAGGGVRKRGEEEREFSERLDGLRVRGAPRLGCGAAELFTELFTGSFTTQISLFVIFKARKSLALNHPAQVGQGAICFAQGRDYTGGGLAQLHHGVAFTGCAFLFAAFRSALTL